MTTYVLLWQYLNDLFLAWEMFQTNLRRKSKQLFLITFLRKLFYSWDNVETYGTAGQATGDNIIQHMNIACWITKATDTRSWCVILPDFPLQQWLHERASILRYTYIACVVTNTVGTQNFCDHRETYLHMYCLLVIWRKVRYRRSVTALLKEV
jgi:hypothetical protein